MLLDGIGTGVIGIIGVIVVAIKGIPPKPITVGRLIFCSTHRGVLTDASTLSRSPATLDRLQLFK